MANLRTNNLSGEQGQNAYRGSLFFEEGGGDKLSIPNTADVRLGSNDFTVEAWVKFGNVQGSWDTIIGMWDHTNTRRTFNFQRNNTDGKLYLYVSTDGGSSNWAYAYGGNLTINDWHHVAGVRDGNTLRVYQNGVQVGTESYSDSVLNNTTDALFIGDVQVNNNNNMNGFISNVRFINGTCIYPNGTTFTPPTNELTLVPNTVVLACQDSDNPLQEATGKTLTGFGRYEHLNDTELVTNGSGTTTTGWTNANTSTFTVEDGMIKVTRSGGSGPTAYQTITTVAGQQYTVSANIQYVSGNYADLRVYNGSDSTGTLLKFLRSTGTSTDGNISSTFTAESTSTTLFFVFDDGGNTGKFSQISVKAADRGKQPKVIPPYGVDAGNTFGGSIQQSSEGYMYFPTGRIEERGRGRGLNGGSSTPSNITTIDYFQIQSTGNTIVFGDLTTGGQHTSCSSNTRGVFAMGGQSSPGTKQNVIDFVTIATTGNAIDFGDRTVTLNGPGGLSNDTRGIFAGGGQPNPQSDVIDFITIATAGNATNFGDMTSANKNAAGLASPTRGILAHGGDPITNVIDKITIASQGTDASDFGDTTNAAEGYLACASNTRGIFVGGNVSPSGNVNTIQFITIASEGNATDFGDIGSNRVTAQSGAGTSNNLRGVTMGGFNNPNQYSTTMEFVNIATTGNSNDFGFLTSSRAYTGSCSDSHGGLS